jgi:hypothetical protein
VDAEEEAGGGGEGDIRIGGADMGEGCGVMLAGRRQAERRVHRDDVWAIAISAREGRQRETGSWLGACRKPRSYIDAFPARVTDGVRAGYVGASQVQ